MIRILIAEDQKLVRQGLKMMIETDPEMKVTGEAANGLIPIVATSSAMIGGAYWPLEIVTNPFLIALSKVVPMTYGMEALKGVAYYG